jgi:hypothetical protein
MKRLHGARGTPEYTAWRSMITRCNPKYVHRRDNKYYAGRGVTVCAAWQNDFLQFLKDVGPRPSSNYSLDRWPDNHGNYEPGNVRWATKRQQMLNMSNNRVVCFRGRELPVTAAIRLAASGLHTQTVLSRLKLGWDVERAVTEPPRHLVHHSGWDVSNG